MIVAKLGQSKSERILIGSFGLVLFTAYFGTSFSQLVAAAKRHALTGSGDLLQISPFGLGYLLLFLWQGEIQITPYGCIVEGTAISFRQDKDSPDLNPFGRLLIRLQDDLLYQGIDPRRVARQQGLA